ncbi:hypothetical protein ACFFX0_17000 [Citricoccus parietis]|uniref:Uncharacterized protein n=1 Tax=Citricoccus parietis TaxID=592307 RepID=A0ABV5G1M7_9MICC
MSSMECWTSEPEAPFARYIQMAQKCRTSRNCQIRKSRQRGAASAARGMSQMTNWGEYTLLHSTNAATIRKTRWATRGR